MTSTARLSSASGVPSGLPSSIGPFGSNSCSGSGLGISSRLADHEVAVHRRLEPSGRAGEVGGPVPDAVHLDVVGVAVVAVPVVEHDDVGLLLAQDRRQPLAGLVDVGPAERTGIVVLLPARHARSPGSRASATSATPSAAADAADSVRRRSTSVSPAREVVGRLAVGAVGAHDEHDAVALRRRTGHRPARQAGLVVGVGVDEHDAWPWRRRGYRRGTDELARIGRPARVHVGTAGRIVTRAVRAHRVTGSSRQRHPAAHGDRTVPRQCGFGGRPASCCGG